MLTAATAVAFPLTQLAIVIQQRLAPVAQPQPTSELRPGPMLTPQYWRRHLRFTAAPSEYRPVLELIPPLEAAILTDHHPVERLKLAQSAPECSLELGGLAFARDQFAARPTGPFVEFLQLITRPELAAAIPFVSHRPTATPPFELELRPVPVLPQSAQA